jgi:hypothetical protein
MDQVEDGPGYIPVKVPQETNRYREERESLDQLPDSDQDQSK